MSPLQYTGTVLDSRTIINEVPNINEVPTISGVIFIIICCTLVVPLDCTAARTNGRRPWVMRVLCCVRGQCYCGDTATARAGCAIAAEDGENNGVAGGGLTGEGCA